MEAPTMMGYGGGWHGMGWFGWGGMLLFWLAVVVLVAWAIRAYAVRQRDDRDPAVETLRRRYAAGEITESEYEQARRVLAGESVR
jgi:putative membrane protein